MECLWRWRTKLTGGAQRVRTYDLGAFGVVSPRPRLQSTIYLHPSRPGVYFTHHIKRPEFLTTMWIYVSYGSLKKKTDHFTVLQQLNCFYNRDGMCRLPGMTWILENNSGPSSLIGQSLFSLFPWVLLCTAAFSVRCTQVENGHWNKTE
jgi:hypothetical protein